MITSTVGWIALWILAGSLAVIGYLVGRMIARAKRRPRFYGFCGVCGQPLLSSPSDLGSPTYTSRPAGTTADGKVIMRPFLDQPFRMDPETGAVCTCPPLGGTP